ncbi:hypothetical protein L596_003895 [Steinernema carpocapsae]|uniref:Mitochondrial carrier protein n=1 Tax=Steinernema carpocapsae TaxID=34508 RepID=A0A4U8UU28_STECR|nr:hypothetical protein L596_003895 [Steinernema carpocapsae]
MAETVTYPLDITKTRLQILSHSGQAPTPAKPQGMFRVTFDIVRHEGPLSLWRGVAPAIYRHYVYTGIRMGTYEFLRGKWFDRKREKTFSAWKSMTIGLFSGAFAQFVASPADLVKVQMQMEGLRKLQNLPPRFHSTWHAFVTLYRANGFFGLWIGWVPNCQRAALLNMAGMISIWPPTTAQSIGYSQTRT